MKNTPIKLVATITFRHLVHLASCPGLIEVPLSSSSQLSGLWKSELEFIFSPWSPGKGNQEENRKKEKWEVHPSLSERVAFNPWAKSNIDVLVIVT